MVEVRFKALVRYFSQLTLIERQECLGMGACKESFKVECHAAGFLTSFILHY